MWIDAHAHLNSTQVSELDAWLMDAKKQGIGHWILGGVNPDEWQTQKELSQKYPQTFKLSFGLHPWFIAQSDSKTLEAAFLKLKNELACKNSDAVAPDRVSLDSLDVDSLDIVALGELGLDFNPKLPLSSYDTQRKYFIKQLELLNSNPMPLVLHVLDAHDEALITLRRHGAHYQGIVHSYSGTLAQAEQYLDLGFKISFSYSVLSRIKTNPQNPGKAFDRLKAIVVSLKPSDFVLETDAPDQPPKGADLNHPLNLIELAKIISEMRAEPWTQILDQSTKNLKQIFYGNTNLQK